MMTRVARIPNAATNENEHSCDYKFNAECFEGWDTWQAQAEISIS